MSALAILLVAWLAASRARSSEDEADALRALGLLLTVVVGVFSAVWWHQSATLGDDEAAEARETAKALNGAAATATGLALIGSVFSSVAWSSAEGGLAAAAFLLLLAMSGGEIWGAASASFRYHGLTPALDPGVRRPDLGHFAVRRPLVDQVSCSPAFWRQATLTRSILPITSR